MKKNDVFKTSSHEAVTHPSSGERERASKRSISSEVLLAERRELVIEHAGEEYHLRITSKGKLILTK